MPGNQLGRSSLGESGPESVNFAVKPSSNSPYSGLGFFVYLLHIPMRIIHFVIDWLKVYEPRWRTILAVIVLFAILSSVFFVSSSLTRAATFTFSQTTWSGGQSASNAAHPGDQSTWDKYSAQNNIDFGTAGAIKTSASTTNVSETFTATTNKDAANTTAAIGEPGIALIQQIISNSTTASQATVDATLTSTTGGNLIIVGAMADGSLTVSSVTDNIGNTYTHATNANLTANGRTTDFFYTLSATSGVTTVTATFSAADTSTKGIVVWEVSGLNSVAFDLAAATSGTAASANGNGASVTTTGTRGLVAALNYSNGTFSATGPNMSANNEFTGAGARLASNAASAISLISTSAAAHQPAWSMTNGVTFTASTVAFKETVNASTTTLWDGSGQLTAHHGQVVLDAMATPLKVNPASTSADLTSLTVGSGSNRALVAELHFAFATSGVTDIAVTWDPSGANQPLTQIATLNSAGSGITELWGLVNPTSGNKTLRVTWTTSTTAIINAVSWTGVDQTGGTTSFPNATTGTGSGNVHSLTITSALGNTTMYAISCNQTFIGLGKPRTHAPTGVANLGQGVGSWAPGAATVTHTLASGSCSSRFEICVKDSTPLVSDRNA